MDFELWAEKSETVSALDLLICGIVSTVCCGSPDDSYVEVTESAAAQLYVTRTQGSRHTAQQHFYGEVHGFAPNLERDHAAIRAA